MEGRQGRRKKGRKKCKAEREKWKDLSTLFLGDLEDVVWREENDQAHKKK